MTDGAVQAITAIAVNASDWHTFEFFYDGVTTVRFYADGVLNATVATTTAATFPYAEEMAPIIGVKTGAAAAKSAASGLAALRAIRLEQARECFTRGIPAQE